MSKGLWLEWRKDTVPEREGKCCLIPEPTLERRKRGRANVIMGKKRPRSEARPSAGKVRRRAGAVPIEVQNDISVIAEIMAVERVRRQGTNFDIALSPDCITR